MIYLLMFSSFIGLIILIRTMIKDKSSNIDIIKDYEIIKGAFKKCNRENGNKCRKMDTLKNYLDDNLTVNLKKYSISSDSQWLILHDISEKIIESVTSNLDIRNKVEGNKLYLSFFNLNKSTIIPKAVITMKPSDNINTTTTINWDCKDSVVEGSEIKKVEWKDKKIRYSKKGKYKVELRVQDRNDNWSDWEEKEFDVAEIEGINSISCGGRNLFITFNNGNVKGFGNNKYGQLGNGLNENVLNIETLVRLENVKELSSGEDHTLILQHDRKVTALGRNNYGQLGNGALVNSAEIVEVWGMENIKQVEAGRDFSAALTSSGEVIMWGNNNNCQLGENDVLYRHVPNKLKGLDKVKQISLGHNHTLALLYDGTIISWGDNSHGQCGIGLISKKQESSVISLAGVAYVCAGNDFSLAVLENGKVIGWGRNNEGQLGINGTQVIINPTEIIGLEGIKKVKCKDSFTVAITKTGRVYTWGKYKISDETYYSEPKLIEGIKYAKDVDVNYTNAYVLTKDEKVITWSSDLNTQNLYGNNED